LPGFFFGLVFFATRLFGITIIGLSPVIRAPRNAASKRAFASFSLNSSLESLAMGKIVGPLKINPSLVLHVGMIAIQWARVEFTISRMIVGLLKSDAPVGLLLTSGLGFQTIQHFIACYVQTNHPHGPTFEDEITVLMGEADRLRIIRNSLVHNSWHPDELDEHRLLVLRFRGKIRMYSEVWPEPLLLQIVEELLDLLRGLSKLIQRYDLMESFNEWERRSPSPDTLAPRQLADVPARSPKMTDILNRLQS
jgi:hypothetical protein